MANKPNRKPSDFSAFAAVVYRESATMMEFEEWYEYYVELLSLIFWNPEIDTPIALQKSNPSGVSFGPYHG